ncbi:unnamed protein product [Orchesella dallaii]|uniref:Uncharacterized protein n=1 Tax=Orchesella dallaii TaxID=48710 RepID=A0ABP1PYY5_9HEXA
MNTHETVSPYPMQPQGTQSQTGAYYPAYQQNNAFNTVGTTPSNSQWQYGPGPGPLGPPPFMAPGIVAPIDSTKVGCLPCLPFFLPFFTAIGITIYSAVVGIEKHQGLYACLIQLVSVIAAFIGSVVIMHFIRVGTARKLIRHQQQQQPFAFAPQ